MPEIAWLNIDDTLSLRLARSCTYAGGRMSSRRLRPCPALTKAGPRRSRVRRNSRGRCERSDGTARGRSDAPTRARRKAAPPILKARPPIIFSRSAGACRSGAAVAHDGFEQQPCAAGAFGFLLLSGAGSVPSVQAGGSLAGKESRSASSTLFGLQDFMSASFRLFRPPRPRPGSASSSCGAWAASRLRPCRGRALSAAAGAPARNR
jgi:hypothetical protein